MQMFNTKMKKLIASIGAVIGLAGTIGIGATQSANAANTNMSYYLGNGTEIHYSGNRHRQQYGHNYGQPRRYQQRHRRDDYYRHQPRRHVCGPRRAVKKAYRRGMNNPHVLRIKQRRIVVGGYQYGYRTKMVFDRYSNCRLIRKVGF